MVEHAGLIGGRRDWAVRYAWALLGTPYRWGGEDPIEGFDCSGLISEILAAVDKRFVGMRRTASGWHTFFATNGCQIPVEEARITQASLVFWKNKQDRISHIGIMVGLGMLIDASGGDSRTVNDEQAAAQDAFVKMRPWDYRGLPALAVDPFRNA